MALWGTDKPVERIWSLGGQLNLLIGYGALGTVEPVKRIWSFGRQLNLLNGHGGLEDIYIC